MIGVKLESLKSRSVIKLFSKEECESIIESVVRNSSSIKYTEFINLYPILVDAYRIQCKSLDKNIEKLILDRVNPLSDLEIGQCFILKYDESTTLSMKPHYDICPHTLVINLNNDFNGGATHFPINGYKFEPQKYSLGCALFFRGDTTLSWHEAMPVTKGVKYSLNVKYKYKGSNSVLWSIGAIVKYYLIHILFYKLYTWFKR